MDSLVKKTWLKASRRVLLKPLAFYPIVLFKSYKDIIELNIVLIFNNTCAIRLGNFFSHKLVCLLEKKVLEASKI